MMINVDIRLADGFKRLSGSLKVRAIHSDEGIECSLDGGLDLLCAIQIFEGRWHAVRQNHFHSLARLLKSQSQSQQRADRVSIGTDVGSNENLLRLCESSLDCFVY